MPTSPTSSAEAYKSLIIETALANGISQPEQIAYMLATAHHETGAFKNLTEYGSDQYLSRYLNYAGNDPTTDDYIVYRGHGFAQLTGKANFDRVGDLLGYDLVAQPSLAAEPEIAAEILVIGMRDGLFTGYRLDRAINDERAEYGYARQVINGHEIGNTGLFDHQVEIAELAKGYEGYVEQTIQAQTPAIGMCTIDGQCTAENTAALEGMIAFVNEHVDGLGSCRADLDMLANTPTLNIEVENTSDSLFQRVLDYITGNTAEASSGPIDFTYAGDFDQLGVTLSDSDGNVASQTFSVQMGYVRLNDENPIGFDLQQFDVSVANREIEVEYHISHDLNEDVTGTLAKFWLSQDGTLDGAVYIGSESPGVLSKGENNREFEAMDIPVGLSGEWQLITTLEADGVDQFVYRTDTIDLGEANFINLSLEDVSLNADSFGDGETDLEASFTVVNSGNISTAGMKEGTGIFWSADDHFDINEDVRIDYDTHGTLQAGEHDAEFERTNADELGFNEDGFIFLMVDPDNVIAESDETDNVSGPIAVSFEAQTDGPDIDLSIEDITFREDRLLSGGQDVRADFVVVNSGSESTAGMDERTGIFWSADDHFDFNEDMMIDYDTHGTLYAGERDSEYERTRYEDIPDGQGYLFYVVDPLDMIAETNEINNVSDAYMVWVL